MIASPSRRGSRRPLSASVAWACLALATLGSTCEAPPSATGHEGRDEASASAGVSSSSSSSLELPALPAGTSCGRNADCPSEQVCVEASCRHRRTSVAGEILASSAQSLASAGDWDGAIATYRSAIEAFQATHAPVPAEVVCEQAALMLSTATDPEHREAGAVQADACFRASLPGFAPREEVRRAVARLRFQGLDVALFDDDEPAARFFTQEQSAPTVDAIELEAHITAEDLPGLEDVRAQLASDDAHRAMAECFIQDWEIRHEREARGALVLRYSTRMRDMGTYDAFTPELVAEKTSPGEDGFEPCLARALSATLTAPRAGRVVSWQAPLEVGARIH